MADTLTPEKWGRKESADWWSAGQAARQQIYGAATEMMLDLAGVQPGSRVFKRFEGPNGFEAPGEVLIGVGKNRKQSVSPIASIFPEGDCDERAD